jgi:hypothetical protein
VTTQQAATPEQPGTVGAADPQRSWRTPRTALSGVTRRVQDALAAWGASTNRLDLVILLTLLLLIMRAPTPPGSLVHLMCFAGIIYRPVTRQPAFWFTLVALWVLIFLPNNWASADNHKWLIIYWALALGLAMRSTRPLQVLATNARLLIGLVFLSATVWKIVSPDFPDGGFFHLTLLTDVRFTQLAEIVGGLDDGASSSNRAAIDAWDDPTGAVTAATLQDGSRVAALAQLMALCTIVLEGLVAVAFLAPERWKIARVRELFLLLFVVATYPIAPVVGFGWLLVVMGLAQSRLRRPGAEAVYVLAFLAIFAFTEVERVLSLLRRVASVLAG